MEPPPPVLSCRMADIISISPKKCSITKNAGETMLCCHLGPFRYTCNLPPAKDYPAGSMLFAHE